MSPPPTATVVQDSTTLSTHLFRDQAVRVIKEHDPQRPLFLYVALPNVHRPLMDLTGRGLFDPNEETYLAAIPSRLRRMFAQSTLILVSVPVMWDEWGVQELDWGGSWLLATTGLMGLMGSSTYLPWVQDKTVRDIWMALEEAGLLDNSLIAYASDNGACYRSGGNNAPYRGTKHYTFEGR